MLQYAPTTCARIGNGAHRLAGCAGSGPLSMNCQHGQRSGSKEASMKMLTDRQRNGMRWTGGIVGPMHNPVMRAWIGLLDVVVRVLTLGRGRVVVLDRRAPARWDGVIE